MTTLRPISTKTWNEIYELVGRIQRKAIESRDWQIAKDTDAITTLLRNLPDKMPPQKQ